jgi:hypothetical protein
VGGAETTKGEGEEMGKSVENGGKIGWLWFSFFFSKKRVRRWLVEKIDFLGLPYPLFFPNFSPPPLVMIFPSLFIEKRVIFPQYLVNHLYFNFSKTEQYQRPSIRKINNFLKITS